MRRLMRGAWGVLFSVGIVGQSVAATTTATEYIIDDCHFSFFDPYNGRADVDNESSVHSASYIASIERGEAHSVGEVSIVFVCKTTLGQKAFSNKGIAHNNGEWGVIPDKSDPENLANLKVYSLRGNDVDGAAITYAQTTGEEDRRVQGIGFCLTNQKQILCGTSEAVGYVAYPKQSSLPKVLELLKSIKFLEPTK